MSKSMKYRAVLVKNGGTTCAATWFTAADNTEAIRKAKHWMGLNAIPSETWLQISLNGISIHNWRRVDTSRSEQRR